MLIYAAFVNVLKRMVKTFTKKGFHYLRKALCQAILSVIRFNPVFNAYYYHKLSQDKGHRCAQKHCVRKLLRIIYHLVTTNQQSDPELLRWRKRSKSKKLNLIEIFLIMPFYSHFQRSLQSRLTKINNFIFSFFSSKSLDFYIVSFYNTF